MHDAISADPTATIRSKAELFNIAGQSVIATATDGTIVYWSSGAAQMYGWSEEEALGSNIVDVTPSAEARAQAIEIMAQLSAGQVWRGRFPVRRRDGTDFIAVVQDVPVTDEHGNLIGIVGISAPA